APAKGAAEREAKAEGAMAPSAAAATSIGALGGRGAATVEMRRAGGEPLALGAPSSVKAGEWDDNANYLEFQRWLQTESGVSFHGLDLRDRRFLVVRDDHGRAVPACPIVVTDQASHIVRLTTTSSGRAILFPHAAGLVGGDLSAVANCGSGSASARFPLAQDDGVVDLDLATSRTLPAATTVDLAFILDTTGSMSEEIAAVKGTIQKVAIGLAGQNAKIRVGMIEYRDRGDDFVTRAHPMTTDIGHFAEEVAHVAASGGGDMPESVNAGLHAAMTDLAWQNDSMVKLAFLIGDAPPHLDYAQDFDYAVEMRRAAERGIQVYTIAASGMDDLGQVVFRQIAQYTGATNMFVLRGGAGPQSTGAGDPKSSCGGTQTRYASGNLDALILSKVNGALDAINGDPLKIAGLRGDENAKPCSERVLIAR
ncbi:MAG TPA: vWA domain-containing protein, partial [Polyangiaceae bacterium]